MCRGKEDIVDWTVADHRRAEQAAKKAATLLVLALLLAFSPTTAIAMTGQGQHSSSLRIVTASHGPLTVRREADSQLSAASTTQSSPVTVTLPGGVKPITVSAGNASSLAVGNTGSIYAWGSNASGQLGDGTTTDRGVPTTTTLPGGTSAIAVASGNALNVVYTTGHSLAVGANGVVYAWGDNSYGQLGDGTTTPSNVPVTATLPGGVAAVAVAGGNYYSLALGANGMVYAWGDNYHGQLGIGQAGLGSEQNAPVTTTLPAGVRVVAISAGGDHSLALGANGVVYAWGVNDSGQVGNGTTTNQNLPTAVSLPGGLTAIALAAGYAHSLALGSNHVVYTWGSNYDGRLGDGGKEDHRTTPAAVRLPGGIRATAVAAGANHSLALGADGIIYAWGGNQFGELGDGTSAQRGLPVATMLPNGVRAVTIAAGFYHSLAVGANGRLYAWGDNSYGQLGLGSSAAPISSTPCDLYFDLHHDPTVRSAAGVKRGRPLASVYDLRSTTSSGQSIDSPTPLYVDDGQGTQFYSMHTYAALSCKRSTRHLLTVQIVGSVASGQGRGLRLGAGTGRANRDLKDADFTVTVTQTRGATDKAHGHVLPAAFQMRVQIPAIHYDHTYTSLIGAIVVM